MLLGSLIFLVPGREALGPRLMAEPLTGWRAALVAGYTLIQVKSREEALEWTRRFPKPHFEHECAIEVRQLYELEDFATIEAAQDAIGKFREMETQLKK